MMSKRTVGVIMLSLLAAINVVGMLVLYYFMAKRLDLPLKLGHFAFLIVCVLVGGAIGLLYMKYRRRRLGNTPLIDERTRMMVQKFMNVMFAILLIGGSIAIITLFFIGIETIEVGLLALVIGLFFVVCIIGLFIIKKT